MIYPVEIARCQHIKTNGTQCGSPALKKRRFCYFHQKWRDQSIRVERQTVRLPVLEDANSVQVAVMEILRLLLRGRIDAKRAGLLLYGLQTASSNLKKTAFEPELPTTVVIDHERLGALPIGATAWSGEDVGGYDDLEEVMRARMERSDGEEEDDDDNHSLARTLLERLGLPEAEEFQNQESGVGSQE